MTKSNSGIGKRTATKVAIVTCAEFSGLTKDDQLLCDALKRQGATVEPLVWSEDKFDSHAHLYVVRSPWDYHLHIDRYLEWHHRSIELGRRFINSNLYIEWNFHKKYLLELASFGLPVIETELLKQSLVSQDRSARVTEALKKFQMIVVKPAISASSFETRILELSGAGALQDEDRSWVGALGEKADLLLQPFISEISKHGELSLVWIGEGLSHGYLKIPKPGDFRSQEEYGARLTPVPLEPWMRKLAEDFIRAARDSSSAIRVPEFARIDLLTKDGKNWFLGELELFEPALQLGFESAAADRLATAILKS